MRLLLDTHTFLWWIDDAPRVSQRVRTVIADDSNTLYVSAVTGWEIAIKVAVGRLTLQSHSDPSAAVLKHMDVNAIRELPVRMEHALRVATLPPLHGDPFDRLLVAQAMVDGLTIVTSDRLVAAYDVETIW